MKTHKTITLDTELALELQRRGKSINVSYVCNNALRIACELEKPKTEEDIKTKMQKNRVEFEQLQKLQKEHAKIKSKEVAKNREKEFNSDLMRLREIRKNKPNSFADARRLIEKKYELTNAEVMKKLDKI